MRHGAGLPGGRDILSRGNGHVTNDSFMINYFDIHIYHTIYKKIIKKTLLILDND